MLAPLIVAMCLSAAPDAGALDAGALESDAGVAAVDAAPDGGIAPIEVRFVGNRVLADEVYLAVLNLPPDLPANGDSAERVRRGVLGFLRRSGYDLARVSVHVAGPRALEVDLDEGQLEKIVFRGRLTLKTLRFKLAMQMPQEVFNKPELERQLRTIPPEIGLDHVWYELVPTHLTNPIHAQVNSLGPLNEIEGYEVLHPLAPYELHIFFTEKDWDTGQGLDVRSSSIDGLEVIGNSQGANWLTDGDRYRVAASGGLGLRTRLQNQNYFLTFTRAYAEALYFTGAAPVRPLFELRSELVSRQRSDLWIENYDQLTADALANVHYEYARKQNISFGLGLRHWNLFNIREPGDNDPPQGLNDAYFNYSKFRTFAELRLNYLFDDGGERADRRHEITLEARNFFAITDKYFGEARLAWQRVLAFGWDDLWLRVNAAKLWGFVPFPNDEPVSGLHLRNVFSNVYTHDIASGSVEYRFSLTRDIFKVSLFNDFAVYRTLGVGLTPNATMTGFEISGAPRVNAIGDSFGAGFHVLVQGMFQVDMYYGFGFATMQTFDRGFSVGIQKVF